jgi:hypothetical protein
VPVKVVLDQNLYNLPPAVVIRIHKADTALERRATEKKPDVKVSAVHTRAHFDDPKGLSS